MGSVKKINKIATDENLMEMAQHGSSQYSFRFYCDDLEQFVFTVLTGTGIQSWRFYM